MEGERGEEGGRRRRRYGVGWEVGRRRRGGGSTEKVLREGR